MLIGVLGRVLPLLLIRLTLGQVDGHTQSVDWIWTGRREGSDTRAKAKGSIVTATQSWSQLPEGEKLNLELC